MKLEGELAFVHSNVGRKPESQSFELNDNDQNTAGHKLQNQKVKEYGNKVSIYSKNEEDLDPSSYVIESAECMTTLKHDLSNSMIDSKSDYEAHVFDLVEPVSHHSSEEIESFVKFPNDIESVKRSSTTPISNPPKEIDSFEKPVDVYMDKTITECEPELVVFKESNYHVVKDICVDEGFHNKDKVILKNSADAKAYNPFLSESYENEGKLKDNAGNHLLNLSASEQSDQDKVILKNSAEVKAYNPFLSESYESEEKPKENSDNNLLSLSNLSASEQSDQDKVILKNSADVKAYNPFLSDSYESEEKLKENVGNNLFNLSASEQSDLVPASHDQLKDLMHKDFEVTEKLSSNVNEAMVLPEGKVLLREVDTAVPSDDKGEQISADHELRSQSEDSKTKVEEAVLATPNLASAVNESNSDCMVLENGNSIDSSAPVDCGKMECHESGACQCHETERTFNPVEENFDDDQRITSQVRQSLGESSFSAVGPVSSRISYSGPVPYSGSISLRSDSSTTSTRSFAFPVLQSEWNSSPVRMAKADRSRYRKHRGWRQGLLCCKF